MKKVLIRRLYALMATIVLLFLMPGVDFRWGDGETQVKSQTSFFDPEWRSKLQNITGMLVEMPNPSFVTQYLGLLE